MIMITCTLDLTLHGNLRAPVAIHFNMGMYITTLTPCTKYCMPYIHIVNAHVFYNAAQRKLTH